LHNGYLACGPQAGTLAAAAVWGTEMNRHDVLV
jgi:hypothetical protein